jgi:hypothetical protein
VIAEWLYILNNPSSTYYEVALAKFLDCVIILPESCSHLSNNHSVQESAVLNMGSPCSCALSEVRVEPTDLNMEKLLWQALIIYDVLYEFILFYFSIFTRILWQFQVALHCTFVRLPPSSTPPTNPSPPHLKQLWEVSSFYFMYVYEAHRPYSLTFISIHLPLPTSTPHTVPILQSGFSLLMPKSVFKGFLRSIPL